jgi:hypothetical protein
MALTLLRTPKAMTITEGRTCRMACTPAHSAKVLLRSKVPFPLHGAQELCQGGIPASAGFRGVRFELLELVT